MQFLTETATAVPPTAQATATPTSGNAPLSVQFTGTAQASGGATIASYSWDFGDGTSSTEQNPSHIYSTSGTYTATLTVTDSRGSTGSASVSITVAQPTAILSVSPLSLNFSAQQGGSNPANQTISIRNTGGGTLSYTISDNAAWLTLSPTSGTATTETDTITASVNISGLTVSPPVPAFITISASGATNSPQTVQVSLSLSAAAPPTASASASPTSGNAPLSVQFTGTAQASGGATVVSFLWDFGDGTSSADQNPSHIYSTSGNYAATLTVTDSRGARGSASVAITLIQQPAILSVSPLSLNFSAQAGGLNPSPQNIAITNAGAGTLNWSASPNVPWLSLSPLSGIAMAGSPSMVTVSSNVGGLQAGTQSGTITVSAQGATGSPQVVQVTLQLERVLTSIAITPSRMTMARIGETQSLRAMGTYSDGAQQDVSSTAAWQSSAPGIVAVSSGGEVRAIAPGEATITATLGANSATVTVTVAAEIDVSGIIRIRPQLLAAGFDPTLVDLTDDSFDIIALIRPSAVPVRSVTITQNQGSFSFSMNRSGVLSNGDQLWRATFNFGRGNITNVTLRALWGDRPGEFNVTIVDQAQQRHGFPDLEFGNNPALGARVASPNLIDQSPGIRRVRPQVLAAGFSPTLVDLSDDNFDIIAIVRQGAVPIRTVTLSQNQGAFSLSMNLDGVLDNGDQLWRATFNFGRGNITNVTLRALWGDRPGEFNITVIDEAQQRHSFPDLEFGNNPAID